MTDYTAYAHAVLNGQITAGNYVRMAASRFLSWLDRTDIVFIPEKVDRVVKFIHKFHHYKGKSAREPFTLADWQVFTIANIYGFYWAKNPEKRVIRNVYVECARKQGKSMLIAALSLYALLADGEAAPEVYIVANSAKQAGNLFTMSKTLGRQLDPKDKFISSYRDSLKFKGNDGVLRTLSFNPAAADGFNASFVVTDEYHAAPSSAMYDVMKSSQLQRLNPLNIVITTAGHNLFSACYEMRQTAIEVLQGVKTDDTQFSLIYELDEGDQWDNPEVWKKCNPNLHITVDPEDIAAEVQRAKNNSGAAAEVKTKTLNIWLQSANTWIYPDNVNAATATVDLTQYNGATVFLGVDLAAVGDLTALSVLIPTTDKYVFKTYYFVPESALRDGTNAAMYQRLHREQQLIVTAGNVTDYDYILSLILRLQRDHGFYIAAVFYDNWNSTQFAISCTENGLNMQPFSQSIGSYNRPTKEFERLLLSGKVILDNNKLTRWCISNVALKTDHNENAKPVKGGTKDEKIDGVIAMLTALGGCLSMTRPDTQIV